MKSIKNQKNNKMKKVILLFVSLAVLVSCGNKGKTDTAQNKFELKGKLENANGEQLYLEQMTAKGAQSIDTVALNEKGEFSFVKIKPELGFYRIKITDANFVMLILDSTQQVSITGDAHDLGNTARIEGSPDSKLFWEFNEKAKRSYQRRDSMIRSYEAYINLNKGDEAKIQEYAKSAEQAYNEEGKRLNDYLLGLININPGSLVSIVAMQQLVPELSENGYADLYKKVDEALMQKFPNSEQVQYFHSNVENMFNVAKGGEAPDFTLPSPEGKELSLSSFKGKYVLIDFWASWCGPCRAESPNMVRMYKKFHPKGLEILGVSLDDDKAKWVAAIKKDQLEWNHVSDLGGWKSAAAKLYNVTSIPQTFLLDKEGKIIAKGLRAEGLEAKLEELLK